VLQGTSTTSGATYNWLPQNVNTATVTVNTAGNYTLTVTNPTNGCKSTSVVAVVQNTTAPVITSVIANNSLNCITTNATLTATSAGNTIVWNGGSLSNAVNPAVVSVAGNYTVTATNPINSCTSSSVIAVVQNTTTPVITSAIASNSLTCINTNATLTATSAGNTIVWNGGSLTNAANPAVAIAAGNYTATATNPINGCTSTSVVAVVQNTTTPNVTASTSNHLNCNNTSAVLSATSTTGGLNYQWIAGPSLPNYTVNQAGTYTVTVSNPINGCSNTAIVSVTASPMFTTNITVLSQINCFGANNGALQVNVNGGSMPFTITNLNNNNTLTNINTFPLTLNNLSAGNYSIQVSDASGCQQVLYSSISQPSPLNVLVTGNSSLCAGSSASLSSNVSGGTAPYNFMWSPNGGTAPNTVVSPNVSTTYTLTVTDNNGCQAATNIAIAVNPSPGANVINNQLVGCAPVCASFSLAQNQNGNYNYNWVFTSSAPSPTVITSDKFDPQICFTKEGVYTANVIISTPIGCSTTITYTNLVTVYAKPTADFYYSPTNPTILEPKVSFTNTTVGASQFSWYNVNDLFSQQTNPSFTFQDPGKFLVTLIAGDGYCSDTISKYVVIEDDFSFYIPNAFTPDENNLNDYFYPVMRGYTDKNYVFMIFDRWGELIFKTNDTESKGWDGYYKNQLCKDDAYTWRVYVTDKRSKGHEFTGHVVLMK
jgi:gliding motility-associated-like protein